MSVRGGGGLASLVVPGGLYLGEGIVIPSEVLHL